MTRAIPQSASAGLAYTGTNAYAYAYTGGNAYAYSAPMEAYGFGGFPGNPLLANALNATRAGLLAAVPMPPLGGAGDIGAGRPWPPENDPAHLARYGAQVRNAIGSFDLLSGVSFSREDAGFTLWGSSCVEGQRMLAPLVVMTRPDRAYMEAQLVPVDAWSARRDVRSAEVLTQVAPPVAYFASVLNLQTGRHPRTLEFLNLALQFSYACTMRFKHALAVPRPAERSAFVQPLVEVPMHPALPAGHAVEAHVSAALLGRLAGANPGTATDLTLRQLAHRIALNRVVAGLHYPVDCIAGRLLGDALSSYLLAQVGEGADWQGGRFDGDTLVANPIDPDPLGAAAPAGDTRFTGEGCSALPAREPACPPPPALLALWQAARAEW